MSDQPRDDKSSPDWDVLARYVGGEATPDEAAAVRRDIEADPARGALIEALAGATGMAEPPAPTAAEVESALAAVLLRRDASRAAPPRTPVISLNAHRSRWLGAALRAAAAVLLVAGGGLWWRSSRARAPEVTHFASAVGALDSLVLADGSRVLLGPGSHLTLANGYGNATREMTLAGEARFDVVHDPSRPFVVHTPSASFTDVGTVFSVHSDAGDGARVVVTQGAVSVQGIAGSAAVTLHAGDRAAIAQHGALHVERSAATSEDLAWTRGRLVFQDAPISQVVTDVRRWFGVELQVDTVLSRRHVTAAFVRDSSSTIGPVVAGILGAGWAQDGSVIRIVPAKTAPPSK